MALLFLSSVEREDVCAGGEVALTGGDAMVIIISLGVDALPEGDVWFIMPFLNPRMIPQGMFQYKNLLKIQCNIPEVRR